MPLEQTNSASSMWGQIKCVWHSRDMIQLDMNDWTVSARYEHRLSCAAGGTVGSVITRVEEPLSWEWRRKDHRARQKKGLEIWMQRVMSIICCLMAGD